MISMVHNSRIEKQIQLFDCHLYEYQFSSLISCFHHILPTYISVSSLCCAGGGKERDSDDEDFTQKKIGSEGDLRREEQRQSLNIFSH